MIKGTNVEMSVSVIIPVYNGERFVGEAIESVLAQTYAPLEIIVVDDGSTDGTAKVVHRYCNMVRYVYQDNAGAAAARNHGVAISRGEYLAFLDADDLWDRKYLEEVMVRFAQCPELGVVFTNFKYMDPRTNRIKVHHVEALPERWMHEWHFAGRWVVSPPRTVIRRSLFEKLCGFDIRLPQCEDQDLFLRAMLTEPYDYIKKPLVIVRRFGGSLTSNIEQLWMANKKFYAKHRYTFGRGWKNWILWHKAKSDCRRAHAWAYVMRNERYKAAQAAMEAMWIYPFERPVDWVRLWANILFGQLPSNVLKRIRRLSNTLKGRRDV